MDQRSVVGEPPTQHRQAVIASWWDFYQFEAGRLGIPRISSLTAKIGLSLVGPILHTPNNQPSTTSSLVLDCSLYRSNPVPTGTAPVVPHFCSTPNEQNHRRSGRSVLISSRSDLNGIWSSDQDPDDLRTLPDRIYNRVNPLLVVTTVHRLHTVESKVLVLVHGYNVQVN